MGEATNIPGNEHSEYQDGSRMFKDWGMDYEVAAGERKSILPRPEADQSSAIDTDTKPTELHFERRNEIQDTPGVETGHEPTTPMKPMIPISAVLRSHPAVAPSKSPLSTTSVHSQGARRSIHTNYAHAVRFGLAGGLFIVILLILNTLF